MDSQLIQDVMRAMPTTTGLVHILTHEESATAFRQFCLEALCMENLTFVLDVLAFERSCKCTDTGSDTHQLAEGILERYFGDQADLGIPIASEELEKLRADVTAGRMGVQLFRVPLFAAMEAFVYDILPRFRASRLGQESAAAVRKAQHQAITKNPLSPRGGGSAAV